MDVDQKKAKKNRKGKNTEVEDIDMEKELKELEENAPAQPKAPTGKAGKKGKRREEIDAIDMEKELEDADEPLKSSDAKGSKAQKGKKPGNDNGEVDEETAKPQPEDSKAAKGKKNKGKNDVVDNETEEYEQDEEKSQPELKTSKGKKGKGKKELEDIDMEKELQELEESAKVTDSKASKGKKKAGKKDLGDFDMEKELQELEEESKAEAKSGKKTSAKQAGQKEAPAHEGSSTSEKSADKKSAKSKESESKTGSQKAADADAEPAKTGDKPGAAKKPNKQVELMKERLRKIKEEEERLQREEDERIRKEEEAEQKRLEELQKEKERKEKKKQKEKDRIQRQKQEGTFMSAKDKANKARAMAMLEAFKQQGLQVGEKPARGERKPGDKSEQRQLSEEQKEDMPPQTAAEIAEAAGQGDEAESDDTVEDWDQISDTEEAAEGTEKAAAKESLSAPMEMTSAKETGPIQKLGNLRSAVVCVLGHVDTGKTKILDKIRRTNVQDNEAGGITQQIGATMVPADAILNQSSMVRGFGADNLHLPGLLIIDTPGHESFSNLRSRGSSLCDIAILVVDIMHGLEPQTIESLKLLTGRKAPFVVALNKIDRLFGWKSLPKMDIRDAIAAQAKNVQHEFNERARKIIGEFSANGENAALFWENDNLDEYYSMVPTSAHSGDGMGNLMAYIVEFCQNRLNKRLTFSNDLQCTVLEVKELTGLGTTVDVILTNGSLSDSDTIVLAGFEGPVVTQVRALLMPQPLRELRVKNPYEKHKVVHGAQGVKILAKDLETCLAGLPLYVANTPEDQERCKGEIEDQLQSALKSIRREDRGVYVQASTLGSLEALLEFLKTSKIPVCGINIGPVHKKDVRSASAMLEHDPQYAVILAFDVKIEREAQILADELGIRIFAADIIYHLFDRFTQYQDELKQKRRDENKHLAIFPCKLKILPQFVFNTRDPIVVGVVVDAGVLKVGTPLTVPSKEFVDIGIVTSIEVNHKPMDIAKKGQEVCIKIDPEPGATPKLLGRHFEIEDTMVSKISRPSIDVCKDYFRDDLTKADWQLMVELKKLLQIM
ncbi:eukaryotic translation initiation factor 5B-like [Paramacrobiotus metropolitanus]|uniref:eukaryotic translation initiation factor 5B-like n=1 Tax=Paramacrobiotus metropolitanus TaxID=2943436 RepID=UPI00244634E7|nr:eukaryotic translation initiation factor 5B-like [Paramacrobiotus metropolitanus]